MKELVLSGINLFEGGPLSIYHDCLDALRDLKINQKYHITAFVHKKELFKKYEDIADFIELPKARSNYIFRLYYEYVYFYQYSKRHNIDVWLSLHDITPNVNAKAIYTYCHNPSPFLKNRKQIKKMSKNVYYMSLFYKYLYRINIKKNTAIIVQQDWIRQEFRKLYKINNIIVAQPDVKAVDIDLYKDAVIEKKNGSTFIYVAFPRPFKNFEVICEACKILEKEDLDFEVWLSIDGSENEYSKYLYDKFKSVKSIKWLGLLSRDEVMKHYAASDCMIFPSLLETWGLPITEYKQFKKPMICAELPYAHETVGNYDEVEFFDPSDPKRLANIMRSYIKGEHKFKKAQLPEIKQPFVVGWESLIKKIIR